MPRKIFVTPLILAMLLMPVALLAQKPNGQTSPAAPLLPVVTAPGAYSGSAKLNHVRIWEPSRPLTDPAAVTSNTDVRDVRQTTQYFDGLGRLLQTVNKAISPATAADATGRKDLVTPVVYDSMGREKYKYLPYVATVGDGTFKLNAFAAQATANATLYAGEQVFYSETVFERSPLGRAEKTLMAGNAWAGSGRGKTTQYDFNTAQDSVRIWDIAPTAGSIPVARNYTYAAGEMDKTVSEDEDGKKVVEYRNNEDKVVLKKVQIAASPGTGHSGWLCTYYVYDVTGNLRYVLPPKAVEALLLNGWSLADSTLRKELCFRYEYDQRQRMVIKQVPGTQPVEMVYDVRDRLVFVQDGNLRPQAGLPGKWLATLYDALNRPVMTGFYTTPQTGAQLAALLVGASSSQTITYNIPAPLSLVANYHDGRDVYKARQEIIFIDGFDSGTDTFETELNAGATTSSEIIIANNPLPGLNPASLDPLTYTYYDQYAYDGKKAAQSLTGPQEGNNPYADPMPVEQYVQGLTTGVKVRVMGTDQWLTTTTYYDAKGRVRQVLSDNIAGGEDALTNLYDFTGKLLSTWQVHRNPRSVATPQTTVLTMMEYDHGGRVKEVRKQLNGTGPVYKIATNAYDVMARLKKKTLKRANDNPLETLDYDYNIQGWLQGINKGYVNGAATNFFGQELNYDYGFSGHYNGNIAGLKWKGFNQPVARAHGFSYDAANRLMKADFSQYNGSWVDDTNVNYDVLMGDGADPLSAYDANGNIKRMQQWGMKGGVNTQIDNLTYAYADGGNKLQGVADSFNDPNTTLGDFKEATQGGLSDYGYDLNGNMVSDANKGISQIVYNHLNLPQLITIPGKGTIRYDYDAAGVKHRKVVTDQTGPQTSIATSDYIGGMFYEQDSLRFVSYEEGRVRMKYTAGQPVQHTIDYFIKDHLGNVRMVLTDNNEQQLYLASMEAERSATENALFNNIESSRSPKPAGYPQDASAGARNDQVAKLNGNHPDKRVGPSLVLRVMAGDTISIGVKAFYKSTGSKQQQQLIPIEDMAASLLRAFGGAQGGNNSKEVAAQNAVRTPFNEQFLNDGYQRMKKKEPADPAQARRPKAYLNFALFNDRFNLVGDNSGVRQVKAEPDQLQTLAQDKMVVKEAGFLYVYTSNETPEDVFFDNLVVTNSTGPVLEETHYYPFGLTMAEISFKAVNELENKKRFNGYEQQHNEFGDGSGLEWYDYKNRFYDNQVGRFFCVDGMAQDFPYYTPYQFAGNEVPNAIDLDGLEPYRVREDGGIFQAGDNLQTMIEPGGYLYMPEGSPVAGEATATFLNMALDYLPVVGQVKGVVEGVVGYDLAGNRLSAIDRALNLIPGRKAAKAADAASGVSKANKISDGNKALRESAEIGQEAHRQIQKELKKLDPKTKVESPITLNDGRKVRKDAVKRDGTAVIIKPDTPSGRKSAASREKLMENNKYKTETIYYDPKDSKYRPGSPTYIGPKKKR